MNLTEIQRSLSDKDNKVKQWTVCYINKSFNQVQSHVYVYLIFHMNYTVSDVVF